MMKTLILLTSIFGLTHLTFSECANALTPTEIRSEIQTQISQRHPTPSDQFWQRFGPEAAPVVRQMYKESTDVHEKSWLVEGMGHYKSQITTTDDDILKKGMLGSLIRSQGDEVYEFVEPYLKDSDSHVRSQVAIALRDHADSERVRKRLEAFIRQEKLPWVKDTLKKKPELNLLSVQKIGEAVQVKPETIKPSPTPLPEKAWAGEWKGAYITPKKNTAAKLILTLVNEKAKSGETKWKIELKLPKQSKQELREKDVDIVYYQTATTHWIEIRNKKDDSVLIAQRKEIMRKDP
jgi:hypothetical protein